MLWKFLTSMELKLRFHQSANVEEHLTLLYPEKQSVCWMKFMITKRSSGPVTIAYITSRISERWTLWRKKKKFAQQGNLCQLFQQSASKSIFVHTKNHSNKWEKMEGHSRSFTRWRILSNCCIQDGYKNAASLWSRRKTKLKVQDIGIQLDQHWWKRVHEKRHEILMMNIGWCWFMKEVTEGVWSFARTAMDLFVFCYLFNDTLVVFQ